MPMPTYKGSGTFAAGANAVTPAMPVNGAAPVAGDILLLACESENQAISLSTAEGFAEVTNSPQGTGTAGSAGSTRLAVFWKRAVGGDASPTVADSGDHTTAQIHCFSGCKTTGDPWNITAGGVDAVSDTSGSIPGATTTVNDCLVVLLCAISLDGNSTARFSGWSNADLANVTERTDNTTVTGLGGGHGMATGEKATAGAYGATSVTTSANTLKAMMSIALEGASGTTFDETVALGSSVAVTPTGASVIGAALSLATSADISDASQASLQGLASLAASGALTPASIASMLTTLGLSASGALTPSAIGTFARAIGLTADGGFSVTGGITLTDAMTLAAVAAMSQVGGSSATEALALAVSVAQAQNYEATVGAALTLAAGAELTPTAQAALLGHLALEAQSTVAAQTTALVNGLLALGVSAEQAHQAGGTFSVLLTLAMTSTLTAVGALAVRIAPLTTVLYPRRFRATPYVARERHTVYADRARRSIFRTPRGSQ